MPSPVNPFRIDGEDVAGMSTDTRHLVRPGPLTALRHGRFPGSRAKFTIKGRAHYPTLIVIGPLRAADHAALYTLIQQHQDAAGTIGSKPVYLQGETFNNCDLVAFNVLGKRVVPYIDTAADPVESGVQIPVRFTFEIVADPS